MCVHACVCMQVPMDLCLCTRSSPPVVCGVFFLGGGGGMLECICACTCACMCASMCACICGFGAPLLNGHASVHMHVWACTCPLICVCVLAPPSPLWPVLWL